MSQLPEIDYAPLDENAMKHSLKLAKSKHCARPVIVNGQEHHISYIGIGDSGGRIATLVYLYGDSKPYDAADVQIKPTAPETKGTTP